MIKFLLCLPSVANNKSAKKRIQIAERNRLINKSYKSTVRTLTKKTIENCEKYKKDPKGFKTDHRVYLNTFSKGIDLDILVYFPVF